MSCPRIHEESSHAEIVAALNHPECTAETVEAARRAIARRAITERSKPRSVPLPRVELGPESMAVLERIAAALEGEAPAKRKR